MRKRRRAGPGQLRLPSSWLLLSFAGGEELELCAERRLHATVFGLDLGDDFTCLFGIVAARRGFDVAAIAAEQPRPDVRAARLERMRRARELRGIVGRRRLLQLLHKLRRLDQVEI